MNKVLENLLERGFIDKEAKELGLKCKPRFTYDANENAFMEAMYQAQAISYGLNCYSIIGTETTGQIRVNTRMLNKAQKAYVYRAGSMDAAMDITKIIVVHELRHLYQYETGMWVGYTYSSIIAKENVAMEEDARLYSITRSDTERMQAMAKAFKLEQEGAPIKDVRKAIRNMGMMYNPTWTITGRILGLL